MCTPPSSARVGRHQLWTPPRSSESFPHSTLSSSDCDKTRSISFPNKPKMVVKLLYGNMEMMWENWLTGNLQAFKQPCKCWKKAQQRCEKTNFERLQGDEMPQNSQERLSAFSENESLKSKSKDYCQLENCLFSHQHLSKKWRTNSWLCYGKKDLNKFDAREKKGFLTYTLDTLYGPLCDNVTLKRLPSVKAFFPGGDTEAFSTMAQQRWWQWQRCWAKCRLLQSA